MNLDDYKIDGDVGFVLESENEPIIKTFTELARVYKEKFYFFHLAGEKGK